MKRAAWLAAAALAACASFEPRPPEGPLEFHLTGRLAARYESESFTGNVAWSHARQGDEMLISTPMGQGVARIVRDAAGVVLRTAEPREYRAADAETLTQKVLGFRLPLAGLGDWVRARPSQGSPARTAYNDDGTLKTLEQGGWLIEYQEYEGERPKRMRLVYPGVELRFAVSEWK
ncbi:MAG: lipoprotein insertase outer membrane protein LolB [Betaproteobacteria bacterium]